MTVHNSVTNQQYMSSTNLQLDHNGIPAQRTAVPAGCGCCPAVSWSVVRQHSAMAGDHLLWVHICMIHYHLCHFSSRGPILAHPVTIVPRLYIWRASALI